MNGIVKQITALLLSIILFIAGTMNAAIAAVETPSDRKYSTQTADSANTLHWECKSNYLFLVHGNMPRSQMGKLVGTFNVGGICQEKAELLNQAGFLIYDKGGRFYERKIIVCTADDPNVYLVPQTTPLDQIGKVGVVLKRKYYAHDSDCLKYPLEHNDSLNFFSDVKLRIQNTSAQELWKLSKTHSDKFLKKKFHPIQETATPNTAAHSESTTSAPQKAGSGVN